MTADPTPESAVPMPAARVRNLTKTYGSGAAQVRALDDVTLDLVAGEFTAVMGPSGSGKSTLMHCCAALDTADSGSVFIGEQDLTRMKDKGLTRLRRDEIGFVFQSFNLVPTLTAGENIALPMSIAGRKPDQEWYDTVISTVGLGDRLSHKPNELSGGQQQRVAVARALASRPRIVFADEPTGNLDSRSGAEVLELLRRSVDDHGQTVVMVTHDPVAAAWTDRVVFLADGRVVDELRSPTREQVLDVMNRMAENAHDADTMIKTALKSLLGRKVRLLMSTFAIVLGVAFVAGSLIFSDTLSRSFTALFASTVGDVVVRPEGGTTADGAPSSVTLPGSLVEKLRDTPGAARVDGNVSAFGVFVVSKTGKVVSGFGPPAIGGNWSDAPAGHGLQGLTIVEGHEPKGADEVVLDERTAERAGYVVGDKVDIIPSTATALPADGEPVAPARIQPELVGIAGFPSGGSLNGATYAAFDTPTAQDLFLGGADAYTDIWVTAAGGVSQDDLRDDVAPELPQDVEAVTGDDAADESASDLLEAISFLTTFLLIFAGISLVVGAFLIVNTFSILVAQRSRELALLRALGASRRQVMWSVQLEAFVLGVVGATIGLGLGVLLAMGIRALFANFGLDLSGQPLIFAPRTFIASYAVGIVVTMAAAWLPARRTGRISPVQAMRDDVALPESSLRRRLGWGLALTVVGLVALALGLFADLPRGGWQVGGGVLAILLGVAAMSPMISRPFLALVRAAYARVFGSVGNLAGQNSLRNPRRTAATASALMIGLALAGTMAIVGDSAKASIDQSVSENFVGDFVVSNVIGTGFSPAIGDQMAQVDGVDQVVRERFGNAERDGDDQFVAAIDPKDVDALELDLDESGGLASGSVLLQRSWAEDHGFTSGKDIELDLPSGRSKFTVSGVFEDNPVVAAPILLSLDDFSQGGFPDSDNVLILFTDDSPGIQDRLDAVVADLPVVTVKDQNAFAQEQREPIDQFVLIIFALLGLALVIAVLGIVNTLALSVIERTREIGLLRAIGLSRRQLRVMITLESVVIAVLGALLGVVLGIGFGVALMYSLRDQGLEVISVPVGQLATFLVLSIVVGVLAAVFPARRAARLDVLRAIATD